MNHSGLSLKAFSATVNYNLTGVLVSIFIIFHERSDFHINPAASFYVVQPVYDDSKVSEKIVIKCLNGTSRELDFHPWASLHHELCGDFSLASALVLKPEEELSVEVSEIDCIHIDQENIANS